ncbi:hypothetical protein YQE_09557, partial [Dendroctonus ponderosae]
MLLLRESRLFSETIACNSKSLSGALGTLHNNGHFPRHQINTDYNPTTYLDTGYEAELEGVLEEKLFGAGNLD